SASATRRFAASGGTEAIAAAGRTAVNRAPATSGQVGGGADRHRRLRTASPTRPPTSRGPSRDSRRRYQPGLPELAVIVPPPASPARRRPPRPAPRGWPPWWPPATPAAPASLRRSVPP